MKNNLKDFQKETVKRVLKLYKNGQHKVLVSDEVGLGKTLIAKGVIDALSKQKKNLCVVYVCSNGAIADQNIAKLNRVNNQAKTKEEGEEGQADKKEEQASVATSRLSMQHLAIYQAKENNQNMRFIPLTPKTSFNTSTSSIAQDRALMFVMLREYAYEYKKSGLFRYLHTDNFSDKDKYDANSRLGKILSRNVNKWSDLVNTYFDHVNKVKDNRYINRMLREMDKRLHENVVIHNQDKKLFQHIKNICSLHGKNKGIAHDYYVPLIRELRKMFTDISLDLLKPDLVILDEFQRFAELIEKPEEGEETDEELLVRKMFPPKTNVLLLSATPYKVYSTLEEMANSNVNEHYEEFFKVLKFLTDDQDDEFESTWGEYSDALKEFAKIHTKDVIREYKEKKDQAEEVLYKKISRTERFSEQRMKNIVVKDKDEVIEELNVEDVKAYIELTRVLENCGAGFKPPIEYIKSTPYLLSFMHKDYYKEKAVIEGYYYRHDDEVRTVESDNLWLKREDIQAYKPMAKKGEVNRNTIPWNNSRLEYVVDKIVKDGDERLLWVPPSLPYYKVTEGPFKGKENFSKTIIFSSWQMVPRMIACLMSYDIEQKTIGQTRNRKGQQQYFEKNVPSRLGFNLDKNKPASMNLFTLLYPSEYLREIFNPLDCMNKGMSLNQVEKLIKRKLKQKLKKNRKKTVDYRWYYLAPLLLDDDEMVRNWFSCMEEIGKDEKGSGIQAHIKQIEEEYINCKNNPRTLGKQPKDLFDVLVDIALGSPAVCMNRTYYLYDQKNEKERCEYVTRFARAYMRKMNRRESIAVVDLAYKGIGRGYWWKVLQYGKDGNMQAMLDEFVHMIGNGLEDKNLLLNIHQQVMDSMALETTTYNIDTYKAFENRMKDKKDDRQIMSMRAHYAVAFTKGDGSDKDNNSKKNVRNAFNSPFWPFVLASTSIGQEGLDFHYYCRKIVHWNLPSNPIDLEQREGRINRFESLALRQSIVKWFKNQQRKNPDVWKEMFERLKKKEQDSSDLIPYWGLPDDIQDKDCVFIESIVPKYPLSKDEERYHRIMKVLNLYRITLGQVNQDELVNYLFEKKEENSEEELDRDLFINLSPYYKKK